MNDKLGPGIHYGISEDRYHADALCERPTLSRSVAWTLARHSAIKGFLQHPRLNKNFTPKDASGAMDFGQLAHALLLGQESRIDIGDFDDYQTAAARNFRDLSKSRGRIPALRKKFEEADMLRKCVHVHLRNAGYLDDFAAGHYRPHF